ncbi:MAG: hypothetical protein M5U22_07770 [Thermoleophilia bacterium]|nr:hypothetical protein [Thermoleophilia bacterium]
MRPDALSLRLLFQLPEALAEAGFVVLQDPPVSTMPGGSGGWATETTCSEAS